MTKVCLIGDRQGWVIDKIIEDYCKFTTCQVVALNSSPDIVWFVSLFDYFKYHASVPSQIKIVVSVHHIDEDKINKYNFKLLCRAKTCIVPNDITHKCLVKNSCINVSKLPYWILSGYMEKPNLSRINDIKTLIGHKKEMLIGSCVKDGNGTDGLTPKLSKGPDIFLDVIEQVKEVFPIKVILCGYARKYMVNGLQKMNVKYSYLEKFNDINSFYDILDWYLVTSRFEGGPQSILEASYRKTKILSTNVGIASIILHPNCICQNSKDFASKIISGVEAIDYNHNSVCSGYLPNIVIPCYDKLFRDINL